FFTDLSEKGGDFIILNRDFLEYLRKALIVKVSEGKIRPDLHEDRAAKIFQLSQNFSANDLIFIIRLFLKSYKDLSGSPDPQVPLLLAGIESAMRKSPAAGQPKAEAQEPKKKQIFAQPEVTAQVVAEQEAFVAPALADELNVEEAESLWPKIIGKIKEVNGPLASMLKAAKLQSVVNGKIIVGVKFAFDKQNIENHKNSALIVSTLREISGKNIGVAAQVIKTEFQPAET